MISSRLVEIYLFNTITICTFYKAYHYLAEYRYVNYSVVVHNIDSQDHVCIV